MADKNKLANLLGKDTPTPALRRGQGLTLSTDAPATPDPAEVREREIAETQKRTSAIPQPETPKRVNRGYMLREDLIKACKRIALDEDRNLYEVMEEALEQYIERYRQESTPHL